MDSMTQKTLRASEVFASFADLYTKTQQKIYKQASKDQDEMVLRVLALEEMEKNIKNSPIRLKQFQELQNKLASDPDYAKTIDPKFVDGILLLNLV